MSLTVKREREKCLFILSLRPDTFSFSVSQKYRQNQSPSPSLPASCIQTCSCRGILSPRQNKCECNVFIQTRKRKIDRHESNDNEKRGRIRDDDVYARIECQQQKEISRECRLWMWFRGWYWRRDIQQKILPSHHWFLLRCNICRGLAVPVSVYVYFFSLLPSLVLPSLVLPSLVYGSGFWTIIMMLMMNLFCLWIHSSFLVRKHLLISLPPPSLSHS